MNYKTPQEAIAACDAECERTWENFARTNNMIESDSPDAYAIGKRIFRAGYMAGAQFVSGALLKKLQNHAKQSLISIDPQI